MVTNSESPARPEKRRRLERVTAACDLCKKRKVKCDGAQPCAYCSRKNRAATCTFAASGARGQVQSASQTPGSPRVVGSANAPHQSPSRNGRTETSAPEGLHDTGASLSPTASRDDRHEDTVVPLEGRILSDALGKGIFIGDCAPLSFLQTVRYLIASEVDPEGFPIHAVRDSIIEVAPIELEDQQHTPSVNPDEIQTLLEQYDVATSGLVDLFQHDELLSEMKTWASGHTSHSDDATAAVFYLVLAVGAQESREEKAEAWFRHAKELLLKHMCNSMNVSTVQGFTLVAIFMLRAFQPNGAYLYFSLAARTAYAIGIHRTEVNASFGGSIRIIRDRIWKSLRVVDMLISSVLGRPPSTSDVDCTVKYCVAETGGQAGVKMLDASVQIFMIIERVVVEVYSRKRISLRIANYVSRQLKSWASTWLQVLTEITTSSIQGSFSQEKVVGACATLCSYYYGIMLLTRPFLIYDLYEYMGASLKGGGSQSDHQHKRKYADAALDAASSFVETLEAVIYAGKLPRRMPLIVSWLFTTSLVLAVGALGRSGLTFADNCKASIRCLEYFSDVDPTARQYSLIVQSLLKTTTAHINKREQHLRLQRKQASSQLFGLLSSNPEVMRHEQENDTSETIVSHAPRPDLSSTSTPYDWTIYDADFFALPWSNEIDQGLQDFLQPGTLTLDGASIADIPLFPIYDQQVGGGSFL
ncbi:uncharacterized protein K460DRAFT_276636 [Cucurbitaria berberidis CBS 394.84]|uniref:Zn(2)-C6 fungal-type domain-containing protein n=1 Tax=Cucurbitaria berberidis CBS 394.84 TaxID=1168544 RepID=A0A9P4LB26_9PLEO|nr:uncharacterized protein K460DRAFT_276636 [Cucurbitaria berberidis CBS 394.84]KAF1849096.1 hypothetical protein K460DRAFT_276636 [Cucurbitaria berberidis CBS 394.84]